MAAPNLLAPATITGKTAGLALTTTNSTDALTCPANRVLKVNSVYAANVDGTNAADVSLSFFDSSANATFKLASTLAVPADATLVLVDKQGPVYLEEGDKLVALAGTASDIELVISYEEIA